MFKILFIICENFTSFFSYANSQAQKLIRQRELYYHNLVSEYKQYNLLSMHYDKLINVVKAPEFRRCFPGICLDRIIFEPKLHRAILGEE
jgi:hypothetical protein